MSTISYLKSLAQHRLLVVASVVALFIGRKVNISNMLSSTRTNNYLDIVVDLRLFILLVVVIAIGGYLFSQNKGKGFAVACFVGIWEIVLIDRGLEQWFHGIERMIYFGLWCMFGWKVWNSIVERWIKVSLFLGVLPFFLFDHFLVSEASSLFAVWFLFIITANTGRIKKILVVSGVSSQMLHSVSLSFQILLGKSIGLHIFGESVLDVTNKGLATWEIGGHEILRGYGLFPHPNISGFIGFLVLFTGFLWYSKHPLVARSLVGLGFLSVVFSGSRMAVIGMLIAVGGLLVHRFANKWKNIIVFGGVFLVAGFSLIRGFSSDIYRVSDLEKWVVSVQSFQWYEWMFGLGPGQYPFFLHSSIPFLEQWQYEPVHNAFLLLGSEIGLVGVCGIIVLWAIRAKKSPLQL
jgi:hypothetical protein